MGVVSNFLVPNMCINFCYPRVQFSNMIIVTERNAINDIEDWKNVHFILNIHKTINSCFWSKLNLEAIHEIIMVSDCVHLQ